MGIQKITGPRAIHTLDPLFLCPIELEISTPEKLAFCTERFGTYQQRVPIIIQERRIQDFWKVINHQFYLPVVDGIESLQLKSPPLWSSGYVIASHAADPGSVPDRVNYLSRFFLGFSSTVRQMSRNLGHIHPWVSFGHHNHPKTIYSSIYGWRRSLTLDVIYDRH